MGADLREDWAVNEAKFDNSVGLWTIYQEGSTDTFKARVRLNARNCSFQYILVQGFLKP